MLAQASCAVIAGSWLPLCWYTCWLSFHQVCNLLAFVDLNSQYSGASTGNLEGFDFFLFLKKSYIEVLFIFISPLFLVCLCQSLASGAGSQNQPHSQLSSQWHHVGDPETHCFLIICELRKFKWENRICCARYLIPVLLIRKQDSEKDDLLISQNSCFFPLNCAAVDNLPSSSEEVRRQRCQLSQPELF